MNADTLFIIIVIIVIAGFIFEQILAYLNASWFKKPVPNILSDIYDHEKYKKQQNYMYENYLFEIINSIVGFILILVLLFFNGFAYLDNFVSGITEHYILSPLLFFGILFLIMDILSIPFDLYDTFVIEEKYGFNKTTIKTYIFDKIKSWILTIIIGGVLLSAIIKIYYFDPQNFWIYAWLIICFFTIFFSMFYSSLIVPLFNKQVPLEEGNLKEEIMKFAQKAGFNVDKIFVIDGSKRSTKANAYFTGLGNKKRIVLYDTLIKNMSVQEIVAVIAHEIGHYKLRHIPKSMIISIIQTGIILYIFGLLAESQVLSEALGVAEPKFHISLLTFALIFSPISSIIDIVSSYFSRKSEFAADNFAKKFGLGEYLISALKKLASNNLSNLTPHPVVVKLTYSHPPIYDRINNLMN